MKKKSKVLPPRLNMKYGSVTNTRDDEVSVWIDKDNLHTEWEGQPERFYKVSKILAEEKLSLEEAKNELEVTYAELDKAVREDPDDFDLECPKGAKGERRSPTEGAIKATIYLQREYQDQLKIVRNIEHMVGLLQAAVTAMHHRKSALENLVHLFSLDYWAEPRAKGDVREAMDNERERRIYKRGQKKAKKRKKHRLEDDDDDRDLG